MELKRKGLPSLVSVRNVMQPIYRIGFLFLALLRLDGQIFLITGSPTPNDGPSFGSSLLRLDEDGHLQNITNLVPPDRGTRFVAVNHEDRIGVLVVRQKGGSTEAGSAVVIDLDKAAVTKQCDIPATPELYPLSEWMSEVPTQGLTLNIEVAAVDLNPHVIEGMTLSPSTPCGQSFRRVHPSELQQLVSDGQPGVDAGGSAVSFNLDQSGLAGRIISKTRIPIHDSVPNEFLKGMHFTGGWVVANTRKVSIIGVTDYKGHNKILALRKRDQIWRELSVRADGCWCFQAFGDFVVGPESRKKASPDELGPGKEKWKRTRNTGRDMLETFQAAPAIYSGRLNVYNIETEKQFQIVTDQADSEIVLIEGANIYYRVNDRLYSAPFTDRGIGTARLLVTDDAIRDAHWAFVKH